MSTFEEKLKFSKYNQELLVFGYIHEFEKHNDVNIITELIWILIEYLNCIFDINFDQNNPNKNNLHFFNSKKVGSVKDKTSDEICVTEQALTNKICNSFKIIFKVTWTNDAKSDYGSYFLIGYLTESIDKSILIWKKDNNLLGKSIYQYAFTMMGNNSISPNNSSLGGATIINLSGDNKQSHSSGDIFAIRYSFETHISKLYHNGKALGIGINHSYQSNKPTQIIPAVCITSYNNNDYGTIQILGCILNDQ